MLALPGHGFVVLSAPKCASTSLQRALAPRAEIVCREHPRLKHMNYKSFDKHLRPLLRAAGYPRDAYEVVTLFREPVSWLHSWWRYRSDPKHLDPERLDALRRRQGRPVKRNYTGGTSFQEYAEAYLAGSTENGVINGRPSRFVLDRDGSIGVDRIFAHETAEAWQGWFNDKLGGKLSFPVANASQRRDDLELTPAVRSQLEEYFAPEYEIYDRLRADGQWSGARGTTLEHRAV